VVTAAHNTCILELLQEVNVHGKADRHTRPLTIKTESRLSRSGTKNRVSNSDRRKSGDER
jgi:hypothetical protein